MKKLATLSLLFIILLFGGCSQTASISSEQSSPVASVEVSTVVSTPVPTPDPFYDLATKQESKWGFEGIYAYELIEKMNEEEFFFYLYDSTMPNTLIEEILQWGFVEGNLDVLAKGYLVDYSTLNDTEKERIREIFASDTLYAIKDGQIKSTFADYPLIPAEDSLDYDMDYKLAIESWFYSTMVGVNNHGFEIITYEEVLKKIENKEKFFLYVGRNSCKYCQIFTPVLTKFLKNDIYGCENIYSSKERNVLIPTYYLDTQSYQNDIIYGIEGAEETWTNIKATLDIEYVPSFIYYSDTLVWKTLVEEEDGTMDYNKLEYGNLMYQYYPDSSYFSMNVEERAIAFENYYNEFISYMPVYGDIVPKEDDLAEETYIDNRQFLFDYTSTIEEDCFTAEEQWTKRIREKEYIDIADEEYLSNLKENIQQYSVYLTQIHELSDRTISYGIHSGTGFIIDIEEDCLYIATNKHVIDCNLKSQLGFFVHFALFRKYSIPYICGYKYFVPYIRQNYMGGVAQIVGYSKDYDFAILRYEFDKEIGTRNNLRYDEIVEFTTPPRFDTANPQIGDKVYRWDLRNIDDNKMTIKDFIITDLDYSCEYGNHFIVVDGTTQRGTSGSPYFNEKGELIGVCWMNRNGKTLLVPYNIILEEFEKIMGRPLYDD